MNEQNDPRSFGTLLRHHRSAAGLTQEELAERAGLSRRGIADLERGVRQTPYAGTVDRLASALCLSESERVALVAAARSRKPVGSDGARMTPDGDRHQSIASIPLYRRVFVGRDAELRQLRAAADRARAGSGELVL